MEQLSFWLPVWIVTFGVCFLGTNLFLYLRDRIRESRAANLQAQRKVLNAKDRADPMDEFIKSLVSDVVQAKTLLHIERVHVVWSDGGKDTGRVFVTFHNGQSMREAAKGMTRSVFESIDERQAWLDELLELIYHDLRYTEQREAR